MSHPAEKDARIAELEKYVRQLEQAAAQWKAERDEAERQWKEWQRVAEKIAADAEAKIVALRADLSSALDARVLSPAECQGCVCVNEHDGDYGASGHAGSCPPHTCVLPPGEPGLPERGQQP